MGITINPSPVTAGFDGSTTGDIDMNEFDQAKAKELADKIIEAEAALTRYLSDCFPSGSRCRVILMTGQTNRTPAEIFSVSPTRYGGEVRVLVDGSKARGSRKYRSIPARDVIVC